MIELQQVCAGYGGRAVLHEVSFTAPDGQVTALVGPNGSGKTTLLRAIAGQLPLTGGSISVNGHTAAENRRAFARVAAYLPQTRSVPAITVETLVGHGRFPYLGLSRRMRPEDRQAVARAMALTGVDRWAGRDLRTLSGGERQRVYIAMALAQDTPVILLDEPTTYLDLGRQFELLELVRGLTGKTVLLVLHDLTLALRYCDRLAVLEQGRLAAFDAPQAVLRSGTARKNDAPIPAEVAPLSGGARRPARKEPEQEETMALAPIKFRYSTEPVVEDPAEQPARPAKSRSRRERSEGKKKNRPAKDQPQEPENVEAKPPRGPKEPKEAREPREPREPKGKNPPELREGQETAEPGAEKPRRPRNRRNYRRPRGKKPENVE